MYPLEIGFILVALAFLVAQNVRGLGQKYPYVLLAAGLAAVVAAVFLGQMRWQMAPAYLLFAILSLLFLKRSYSHAAIRVVGVAFGVLLLASSVVLAAGFPIARLDAPAGPHIVGSTSLSLLDESRDNAFFGVPAEKREVYVQIWYPGLLEGGASEPRARTLWQELYRGEQDWFTLLTGYLRGVRTHSYADIALSPAQAPYPVIVFSHAIVSFAEQNTLLMEHLASHGYVVFALSHPYASMRVVSSQGKAIYPAMDKINEGSAQSRAVDAELAPRIERAGSPEDRAVLQLARYERSTVLNDLTAILVDDLRFVLDSITSPSGGHSTLQAFANHIDPDRIGLLGMSFGGGAVTELCKIDERCRVASNIDGGTFGERQRQPLRVPYLLLSRADQRSLDYLLHASRSDYYRVEVAGASHLDFTDDPVVLPIFKWLGVFGPIPTERVIEITNIVELRFFDAYLRNGPKPRFGAEFPELTVEINDHAAR